MDNITKFHTLNVNSLTDKNNLLKTAYSSTLHITWK